MTTTTTTSRTLPDGTTRTIRRTSGPTDSLTIRTDTGPDGTLLRERETILIRTDGREGTFLLRETSRETFPRPTDWTLPRTIGPLTD